MSFRKHFRGSGYLISDDDMPHVVCRHGHIYFDRGLVASLNGTRAQCMALRRLGEVVMDGDFGELSVRFDAAQLPDVTRIMLPRQSILAKRQTLQNAGEI